jgi:predicted polyphosphate/ATP-dependent NAD kinase
MVTESALRDVLLSLAEQQKLQYLLFSAALSELAAVRETVKGLDLTFQDVIEQKRKETVDATREIVRAQVDIFDETIRRVKNGYVC